MKKFWIIAAALMMVAAYTFAEEQETTEGVIVEIESTNEKESIASAHIETYFIQADHTDQLPKLKPLLEKDPGYHKMLFRQIGFPTEKEIVWETKRLASTTPTKYEPDLTFVIHTDGSMETSTGKPLKALISTSRGYLPGERVTYRFRAADGSVSDEVTLYPQPIIARDDDGKVLLRAEMTTMIPTTYRIELPQMEEGEEFEIKSTSLGQTLKTKGNYSKKDAVMYMPAVEGHAQGGMARIEIKRKSGDQVAVKLPWGNLLKNYYNGSLSYP